MHRFLFLALLAACSGTADKADDTAEADADTDTDADTDADTDSDTDTDTGTSPPDGGALYTEVCSGCHGADGMGTREGPNIVGELDRHDDAFLVNIIVHGARDMPPQDVNEAEAQAIVDWMRANF